MSRILVAIIFHSDTDSLSSCIASVRAEGVTESIVVCDTSASGEAKHIADAYGVYWYDGSRNAGYAWALHTVADTWPDGYDILIASNSDVLFVGGALSRLVSHSLELSAVCYGLQETTAGVVAPYSIHGQLSYRNAVAQWMGIGRRKIRAVSGSVILRAAEIVAPIRIPAGFAGSGAVAVIPEDVWLRTGGFDQDFFLFEEDRSFGTRLDRLGIPAYLCGDCRVVHDGGFSSRGLSVAGTLEFVISEQIAWKKNEIGPEFVLVGLQFVGLCGRSVVSVARSRWHLAKVYSKVLRILVRSIRSGRTNLYGDDGLRMPATRLDSDRQLSRKL